MCTVASGPLGGAQEQTRTGARSTHHTGSRNVGLRLSPIELSFNRSARMCVCEREKCSQAVKEAQRTERATVQRLLMAGSGCRDI